MSEDRRLQVLRAIVQDYVRTSEPVGSKALLERHRLGVSAATVRNDMAVLEEDGLITAPHTSAGRVPTDAGYRRFVDRLAQIRPLSAAQRAGITRFLEEAADLDDVVARTVRLLASLTHQVAVMQYPSLTRSTVRHIELVPLGGARLMIVIIVSTGRVEQRVVDTDRDLTGRAGEEVLRRLRAAANGAVGGRVITDAPLLLDAALDGVAATERPVLRLVAAAVTDALREEVEERVVLAGTSNLMRFDTDFPSSIGPVLEALEEHVVLLRLMQSMAVVSDTDDQNTVAVSIGTENEHEGLRSTSLVATGYGPGGARAGGLGVLGPTRMDYARTMASVRAVAHYVTELVDQ